MALSSLQSSLEITRAHLQKQLRTKEGDCNRMAVQIRVGVTRGSPGQPGGFWLAG